MGDDVVVGWGCYNWWRFWWFWWLKFRLWRRLAELAAAAALMVGSVEGGGGTAAGLEVAFMVVIPMLVLVAALLEI